MCFLDQYYEVGKDIPYFALYRQQKGWKQTSLFEQKGMIALANKDFASPFPPELYVRYHFISFSSISSLFVNVP